MFSSRMVIKIGFILILGLGLFFITMIGLLPLNAQSAAQSGIITTEGRYLARDGVRFEVRGVNYYPKDFAWEKIWTQYADPVVSAQINQELDKASLLGVNTIRLFTPYPLFSGTVQTAPYLDYLIDFINRLQARNMVALVTLFDFYVSNSPAPYSPTDYQASKHHISTVVSALGITNPTVLGWDIKNELDQDYATFGKAQVQAWAIEMINHTRQLDSHHLLTIGFDGVVTGPLCHNPSATTQIYSPTIAAEFAPFLDFISMHYFLEERCFERDLQELLTQVGNKPIILEEFGLHTLSNPSLVTHPHTEIEQAAYYNALLFVSEAYGLAGYLFWTLNDFSYILPGSLESERCLGILRNGNVKVCQEANPSDYGQKPAANTVAHHYAYRVACLDLFDAWVDQRTDEPPPGWSVNSGALLRGYNSSPTSNYLLWSRDPGKVALAKLIPSQMPVIGIASSPPLTNVNIENYPFLTGQVYSYSVRDAINGSHSVLHIGVMEEGYLTRLLTITSATLLPRDFRLDLRQAPTNWNGVHNFQIIFELVPEGEMNGYSATYEFDWIAVEGFGTYLPLIIR